MRKSNCKKIGTSNGFTLLFAVLLAGVLLAIGLAIFNITIKELLLSSSARESQFAFYAADTGAECALFWDFRGDAFSVTEQSRILCNGTIIDGMGGAGYGVPNTFQLDFAPEPYCVDVTVTKTDSPRRTIIESRGYNTCDTGNPRRVERAVRATY